MKHIILENNYVSVKKKEEIRHRHVQRDNNVRTQGEKMVFTTRSQEKKACAELSLMSLRRN